MAACYHGSMWQETKTNTTSNKEALYRKFEFADFSQAFDFMKRVAGVAEGVNHHPRWTNEYNVVEIWLSSHDAGHRITRKDRDLADAISAIASEFIA